MGEYIMNFHQRSTVESAMQRDGYCNWRPPFDDPDLNRPTKRPDHLEGAGRSAAVLVLVYLKDSIDLKNSIDEEKPDGGKLYTVLTLRRNDLSHHPGQISLPGGAQEPGESLAKTAVRETAEEIGVKAADVQIVGELNPVYVPPSDFTVVPFVGWHEGVPNFIPCNDEVAEIVEVDVEYLMNPRTLRTAEVLLNPVPGGTRRRNVPHYQVGPHHVWGATAIMLSELVDRMSSV